MRLLLESYSQAVHDRDDPDLAELRPFHQSVVILFRLLPLALAYSFWVVLVRNASDSTFDRDDLFYTACKIALPLGIVAGALCYFGLAKLKNVGRSRLVPSVYTMATAFIFFVGFILHLHFKLAMGPKYQVRRKLLDKQIITAKKSDGSSRAPLHSLWFPGLKNENKPSRLDVSEKFYQLVEIGDTLTFVVRPRLFGYDTVEEASK